VETFFLETLKVLAKEKEKRLSAFPFPIEYLDLPPARFERTAPGLGILCSIHLSYGGTLFFQVVSTSPLPYQRADVAMAHKKAEVI
jgi:hypothetical protein